MKWLMCWDKFVGAQHWVREMNISPWTSLASSSFLWEGRWTWRYLAGPHSSLKRGEQVWPPTSLLAINKAFGKPSGLCRVSLTGRQIALEQKKPLWLEFSTVKITSTCFSEGLEKWPMDNLEVPREHLLWNFWIEFERTESLRVWSQPQLSRLFWPRTTSFSGFLSCSFLHISLQSIIPSPFPYNRK